MKLSPLMPIAIRKAWIERCGRDPVAAFAEHKQNAKTRGIEFKLTFDQWWALWEPHFAQRGHGLNRMCMCRTRDAGAYEIGNVRIDTNKSNADEHIAVDLEDRRSSADAGWIYRRSGKWGMDPMRAKLLQEEDDAIELRESSLWVD